MDYIITQKDYSTDDDIFIGAVVVVIIYGQLLHDWLRAMRSQSSLESFGLF